MFYAFRVYLNSRKCEFFHVPDGSKVKIDMKMPFVYLYRTSDESTLESFFTSMRTFSVQKAPFEMDYDESGLMLVGGRGQPKVDDEGKPTGEFYALPIPDKVVVTVPEQFGEQFKEVVFGPDAVYIVHSNGAQSAEPAENFIRALNVYLTELISADCPDQMV